VDELRCGSMADYATCLKGGFSEK
jgi:hypothetical protein